jgi:hypothetical protein
MNHDTALTTIKEGLFQRYLRIPVGWSRPQADIADRDDGGRNRAESTPTGGRSGRTRIRAKPVIPLRVRNSIYRPSETTGVRLETVRSDPKRTLRSDTLRDAGKSLGEALASTRSLTFSSAVRVAAHWSNSPRLCKRNPSGGSRARGG